MSRTNATALDSTVRIPSSPTFADLGGPSIAQIFADLALSRLRLVDCYSLPGCFCSTAVV